MYKYVVAQNAPNSFKTVSKRFLNCFVSVSFRCADCFTHEVTVRYSPPPCWR